MKITELKFNGISQPLGYDMTSCTLTWNVEEAAGTHTAGYSVRVSDDPEFREILWEESGTSVPTGGVNLRFARSPRTRYYVAVSVTDETGDSAAVRSWFETGKIDEEWKARWITCAEQDIYPVFGRLFQMKRPVAQARLYLSAAGVFEAYLNGKKIGDEYLTPYLTDYRERMQVITFPVEEYLQEENRLEIMTGKGWYMGRFGMPAAENTYGDRMAVIAELHVTYDNGEEEVIGTDSDWTYRGSDIEESGIYDGERINRMLWKEKDNSDRPVMLLCDAKGSEPAGMNRLTDRLSLPIREKERIVVKEIFCTPAGETVLDMGQNFAGVMEFQADFPEGTKISLEFGEILQNGNFYNENYRSAANPFVYVSDGRKETVRPHFTYSGFRYVRVSGWPGEIRPDDFAGIVMYSDMERTGMIHTSDEKINRLYENTVWGMKSNFWDMPTDCPQRDERLGWTGDVQVFAPAACYHMDTRAFYRKFIEDLKTEQKFLGGGIPNYLPNPDHAINVGSIWGDIATILPDTLYHFYGDREMLSCTYPMMRDWIEFIDRQDEERGQRYLYDFGFTFGDWLALDGTTAESFKGNTDDAYLSSLYYCHSIELTKNAAGILGYEEDRKRFEELHEKVKHAIFQEYFTSSGRLAIDTQAAYVAALRFGIYPDKKKLTDAFRLRLKKDGYQIRCGFVGAPLLCSVLAENGMEDLAWDLLLNEDFPGWLYCVNLGATTIWERWNSVLPDGTMNPAGMNSLNHFSYGSVAEFLYAHVCGIQALEPGFRKVRIAPLPDVRVSEVSCDYWSVSGMYHVSYQLEKDGMIKMRVKVPFDCRAEIRLPGRNGEKIEVSAGEYEYHYRPDTDYRHPYHKATTLKRLSKDPNAMAILGRYVPAYAGIAASGDLEMGANTLVEMSFNDFIPVDREQLSRAMEELEQLEV